MDAELKKEHQRTYTYHFFFVHGLYDQIWHLQSFINSIDIFLKEKLISESEQEIVSGNCDPTFNAENQFGHIFPTILWRTTFLHSYFLLESSLDQICKNIQEAKDYNLTIKDINGKGINKAATYLTKVCKITIPFETDFWKQIQDLNKIRNLFVHADGIFEDNNKEIINIVKKYDGLSYPDFDGLKFSTLDISKIFVTKALKIIECFFQDLHINMK